MAKTSLYFRTYLESKIVIHPAQMGAQIEEHLLENLKNKVERRTIDTGIIIHVDRIVEYRSGIIDRTNFSANAIYWVKYECLLCAPTKNLEMICLVENIIKGYLIARNGPVVVAIEFSSIDPQTFEIVNGQVRHLKLGSLVQRGDHLRVVIINVNMNLGETNVVALCKLLDYASQDEVKEFQEEQRMLQEPDQDEEFI